MRISKPHIEHSEVVPVSVASTVAISEWIIRRELLWLALLAPFMIFPDRRWAWLLAVLPALWVVRFIARKRFVPITPLDWPIALLVAMVAVSMFATFSIDVSLPKITGVLFGVGVYYALVEWAEFGIRNSEFGIPQLPDRLAWVVWGFLAAGAGLAVVGLFGTNWLDKMQGLSDVVRGLPRIVPGLPGAESGFQPNEVAGTLLLVALPTVAIAIWTWVFRRTEIKEGTADRIAGPAFAPFTSALGRISVSFFLLIATLTLVLTQSRGALLGAAIGLLVVLWLLIRRLRIWLMGVLLVSFVILIMNDPVALMNKLLQPVVPSYLTTDPANVRVRLDFWSSALAAIRDAPLTGIGMNTFRYIMPERYPSALIPPGYDVAHAHNVFLQVALDLGLPGLLAYVAIYAIAIVLLVQVFRHAPTNWHRATAAGIGAGLLAYLVFGITDTVALGAKPGVFFWALLSLDVILYQLSAVSRQPSVS